MCGGARRARCARTSAWSSSRPSASRHVRMQLQITVTRGPKGLGLAVNPRNLVAEISPGGQAEADGLLDLGDQVLAVDGVHLDGKPMAEVMTRGAAEYEFLVSREDPALQASLERLTPSSALLNVADGELRLLKLLVQRDANGLGLDMSGNNLLKKVVPGGAADKSGGWEAGDLVVGVNGQKLSGGRLVDHLPRGMPEYDFLVLREDKMATARAARMAAMSHAPKSASTGSPPAASVTAVAPASKPRAVAASPPASTAPKVREEPSGANDGGGGGGTGGGLFGLFGGWGTFSHMIRVEGEEYRLGRELIKRETKTTFEAKRSADKELVRVRRTAASGEDREWAMREGAAWARISPPDAEPLENILAFYGQQVRERALPFWYCLDAAFPSTFLAPLIVRPHDAARMLLTLLLVCH